MVQYDFLETFLGQKDLCLHMIFSKNLWVKKIVGWKESLVKKIFCKKYFG